VNTPDAAAPDTQPDPQDRLSIGFVIPCYNEQEILPALYRRLCGVAETHRSCSFVFLFVNDGSKDATPRMLDELAQQDSRVVVLHFARNMGHQAALMAGLDFVETDIVVTIDADLQDPPELVGPMVEKILEGYDVVHAQRRSRAGESRFKLWTARLFYWLMHRISRDGLVENAGDFRAMTRPVVQVAQEFRERNRFHRALFSNIGFRQTSILYDRDARAAGVTKYPLGKMLRLAIGAVFNYSSAPLRMIAAATVLAWSVSLVYLVKALYEHFILETTIRGWTSLVLLCSFYSGLQLLGMAVLGSYVSRIFEQGQQRPLYWISAFRNAPCGAPETLRSREREISSCAWRLRKKLTSHQAASPASPTDQPARAVSEP